MGFFRLPIGFDKDLMRMMAKFWWQSNPESKKIHWVSLDKLCQSCKNGDLNFRDLATFNQALLTKLVWRD